MKSLPPEGCFELEEPCRAGDLGERCSACVAYADLLGFAEEPTHAETGSGRASVVSAGSIAMPETLAERLRGIPDDLSGTDPLYVSALAGQPLDASAEVEPATRAAHDALAATFSQARVNRPMPAKLAAGLRAIPRRRAAKRLPWWLADSRWAAAACLVLTTFLGLAAGDVSARFQETAAVVSQAPDWLEQAAGSELDLKQPLTQSVSAWKGQAEKTVGETLHSMNSRQRAITQGLAASAIERYEAVASEARAATMNLKNTETARWLAELVQEGDRDD